MQLIVHQQAVAAVRLPAGAPPPSWAVGSPLVSVSLTDSETSVICPTTSLPDQPPGPVEGPLTAVRIAGTLEFSQVGVLVGVLRPLAEAGVAVLAISSFDTDWVLLRAHEVAAAEAVWRAAGHVIVQASS